MKGFSKIFLLVSFFQLLLLQVNVYGQEEVISSEPAYIVIRNKVIEVSASDQNVKLPFTILYPKSNNSKERIYISDADKINMIGKLENPEHTRHLYIDGEEIDFSEGGMFFKIIELSAGRNTLTVTYIPDFGKTVIAKLVINYIQE